MNYKVYMSLYRNEKRLNREEKDDVIKRLIAKDKFKDVFSSNENLRKDVHYPVYYDDMFYFGDPIVLTAIPESLLTDLLTFFKENGLKYWINYLHRMYNFNDLQVKGKLKAFRMNDINQQREFLFIYETNLIKQYENGMAIITNETDINKLIIKEMKGGIKNNERTNKRN